MSDDLEETIAARFEKRITSMQSISRTSKMVFVFKDGSKVQFEMKPNTTAQANGSNTSYAKQFSASVKSFTTTHEGFEFVFQDDSKLSMALPGATFHYPPHDPSTP
jgi:hypothetical protein